MRTTLRFYVSEGRYAWLDVHLHQDDSLEEARRDMGIGLSVCRTIVAAHGGTITAENRKNGGALFRITLPVE